MTRSYDYDMMHSRYITNSIIYNHLCAMRHRSMRYWVHSPAARRFAFRVNLRRHQLSHRELRAIGRRKA